jgi:hypothetical protein
MPSLKSAREPSPGQPDALLSSSGPLRPDDPAHTGCPSSQSDAPARAAIELTRVPGSETTREIQEHHKWAVEWAAKRESSTEPRLVSLVEKAATAPAGRDPRSDRSPGAEAAGRDGSNRHGGLEPEREGASEDEFRVPVPGSGPTLDPRTSAIRFVGGLFTVMLPVVFVLLLRNPISFADPQPGDAEVRVPPSSPSLTTQPLAAEPGLAARESQTVTATPLASETTVGEATAAALPLQPLRAPEAARDSTVSQQHAASKSEQPRRKSSKNRERRRAEAARASASRGTLDEDFQGDQQERVHPSRRERQRADGGREFVDQYGVRYIIVPARRGAVDDPLAFADEFDRTEGRPQKGRR